MLDIMTVLETFCSEYEGDITFYPDYSGRSMYGGTCPGITVNDSTQPFELALALAGYASEAEDASPFEICEALGESRMDSMGLGYILYFPKAA